MYRFQGWLAAAWLGHPDGQHQCVELASEGDCCSCRGSWQHSQHMLHIPVAKCCFWLSGVSLRDIPPGCNSYHAKPKTPGLHEIKADFSEPRLGSHMQQVCTSSATTSIELSLVLQMLLSNGWPGQTTRRSRKPARQKPVDPRKTVKPTPRGKYGLPPKISQTPQLDKGEEVLGLHNSNISSSSSTPSYRAVSGELQCLHLIRCCTIIAMLCFHAVL